MKTSNPKQTIAELLGEVKAEEDNAKRVGLQNLWGYICC